MWTLFRPYGVLAAFCCFVQLLKLWQPVNKMRDKSQRTLNLLGCANADFNLQIQRQFTSGMSWENQGEWHLDHIKPCASFDMTKLNASTT